MLNGFMGSGYFRRLPVYLLLDCSASMEGDPITAIHEGLNMVHRLLMADPQALETVYISVIKFGDNAKQYRLVALDRFVPPALEASGKKSMGAALHLLADSIEQDLVFHTSVRKGDYCPLVFLLTDGEPTDNYRRAVARLKQLRGIRKPTIIALGCGSKVNTAMLREITEHVFFMHTVSPEQIKSFFKWISGSVGIPQ